jgi:hypothetical protein
MLIICGSKIDHELCDQCPHGKPHFKTNRCEIDCEGILTRCVEYDIPDITVKCDHANTSGECTKETCRHIEPHQLEQTCYNETCYAVGKVKCLPIKLTQEYIMRIDSDMSDAIKEERDRKYEKSYVALMDFINNDTGEYPIKALEKVMHVGESHIKELKENLIRVLSGINKIVLSNYSNQIIFDECVSRLTNKVQKLEIVCSKYDDDILSITSKRDIAHTKMNEISQSISILIGVKNDEC